MCLCVGVSMFVCAYMYVDVCVYVYVCVPASSVGRYTYA